MKEQLEHFIRLNLKKPNTEEINAILDIFHEKNFKKGEHFKKYVKICKHLGFIIEGSTRHYVTKNNGNEITVRITQKNHFVADLISMRSKGKTLISIESLEPTRLLVASYKDISDLLEVNLTLNRLLREYMEDNVMELAKLHLIFLTGTAKERYQFILENNPDLLKNFPLRFIASIIGITSTHLSRIRKKRD